MLEGVLRHSTDMTIKHQMTDWHGQSEIGFAFSHFLGFRLLPRLKPIHSQQLALLEAGLLGQDTLRLYPAMMWA
jgi:TnpA family transposase